MAEKLGDAVLELRTDDTKLHRGIGKAETSAERLQSIFKRVGTAIAASAAVAGAALAAVTLKSISLAAEAQETRNLFNVAMGSMAQEATKLSEAMSQALGLDEVQVQKFIATFNQMFTAMGIATEKSFEMSAGLSELAFDMASFFNLPFEEAFQKLQSGISGEIEPLRRLGIIVDENTIKQVAYAEGIAATGSELTQQQKVQARYAAILQQTTNAQGDLARTADSLTNLQRRLMAQVLSLGRAFGDQLIPAVEDALKLFVDIASREDTVQVVKNLGVAIRTLATEELPALVEQVGQLVEHLSKLGAIVPIMKALSETTPGWFRALQESATAAKLIPVIGLVNSLEDLAERIDVAIEKEKTQSEWLQRMKDDLAAFNRGLAKGAEGQESFGNSTGTATEAAKKLSKSLGEQVENTRAMIEAHGQGAEAVEELKIQQAAASAVLAAGVSIQEAMESGLLAAAIAQERLNKHLEDLEAIAKKLPKRLDPITTTFETWSSRAPAEGMKKLLEELGKVADLQKNFEDPVIAYMRTVKEVNDLVEKWPDLYAAGQAAIDAAARSAGLLGDETDDATESANEWSEAFANALAEILLGANSLEEALDGITRAFAVEELTTVIEDFAESFQIAKDAGLSTAGAISYAFKFHFAEIATALVALASEMDNEFAEIAEVAIDAASAIAAAYSGNWVAAAAFGIEAIIGAANLLSSEMQSLEDATEDAFDALADGIATLDEFIAAVSLVDVQLDKAIAANVGYAGSIEEIEEAANVLAERLDDIVDFALEIGGPGVLAALRTFGNRIRAIGGEPLEILTAKIRELREEVFDLIEQRNRFMIGEAESIISGIERMFETGGGNIRFMAQAAIQAFNAMVAAGHPLSAILESLSGVVAKLMQRAGGLGGELGKEFARFGEMLGILSTGPMRRVIESLEAMAGTVEAIGNLGLLTAEQFGAFGRKVASSFNRLVAGGLSSEEALAAIAPQLQQLLNLSEQYGFKLRGNTADLIEQAKAQGLVASQGMTTEDILIAGFDRILMALNAIIEALGGVPIAFEQWTQAVEETEETTTESLNEIAAGVGGLREGIVEAYDTMSTSAEGAAQEALTAWQNSTGGTVNAVRFMVGQVNSALRGIRSPSGNLFNTSSLGMASFQHGSGGFVNFGTGTPAILHGTEEVVTAAEGTSIASMVRSALRERTPPEIIGRLDTLVDYAVLAHGQRDHHDDRLHDIDRHISDRRITDHRITDRRPFSLPGTSGGVCS